MTCSKVQVEQIVRRCTSCDVRGGEGCLLSEDEITQRLITKKISALSFQQDCEAAVEEARTLVKLMVLEERHRQSTNAATAEEQERHASFVIRAAPWISTLILTCLILFK